MIYEFGYREIQVLFALSKKQAESERGRQARLEWHESITIEKALVSTLIARYLKRNIVFRLHPLGKA